jgi:hypothetical protein
MIAPLRTINATSAKVRIQPMMRALMAERERTTESG